MEKIHNQKTADAQEVIEYLTSVLRGESTSQENAEELKLQVEVWMLSIPFRMQRIIKYKIFEDLTWQQVADRMGRKTTEDSVRKEFQRFFEKN